MDQILDGLEKASGHLAATLNVPPLDIPGLRREWERLKNELKTISPKNMPALELLERVWKDLQESSKQQGRSVLGEAILDHYTNALAEIGRTGLLSYWTREFRPYLRGAAEQFATHHGTLTERLLHRRG